MHKSVMIAALALSVAATAANATLIVQYSQIGRANTLRLTNTGANFTIGTIGSPLVTITLNDPFSNASMTTIGIFKFTGTGIAIATVSGSSATELISSGNFSLKTLAPITFGSFTGTNVLSANFTNGFVTANIGTATPQLSVNTPFGAFTSVTSDFYADPRLTLTDMSITTSGASPLLALIPAGGGNQKLRNFQSSSTGTFDAAVVPEPASWALIISGFGLVGMSMRRRKRNAVAA